MDDSRKAFCTALKASVAVSFAVVVSFIISFKPFMGQPTTKQTAAVQAPQRTRSATLGSWPRGRINTPTTRCQ